MINAEFLGNCSDEQINKGVVWLAIKEWGSDSNHKRKSIDYYCSQGLLNSVTAGNVNYCANPSDIMPCAFDNGIGLIFDDESIKPNWIAIAEKVTGRHHEYYDIEVQNTNPLRAICEVYILMSVAK
jgi:hypothetical protein